MANKDIMQRGYDSNGFPVKLGSPKDVSQETKKIQKPLKKNNNKPTKCCRQRHKNFKG